MTSRMKLVQDAARMAMADHRAATPRKPLPRGFLAAFAALLVRLLARF